MKKIEVVNFKKRI